VVSGFSRTVVTVRLKANTTYAGLDKRMLLVEQWIEYNASAR